ncbi:hypothetical protein PUN28_007066 [Cardiocondyla obscurior]|uniref:Uncharacterized protein n=1 Tax=Cardiocondyla obscurior TaxID=286306 RepID=A0AAW2G449_9HYME
MTNTARRNCTRTITRRDVDTAREYRAKTAALKMLTSPNERARIFSRSRENERGRQVFSVCRRGREGTVLPRWLITMKKEEVNVARRRAAFPRLPPPGRQPLLHRRDIT